MNQKLVQIEKRFRQEEFSVSVSNNYSEKSSHWTTVFSSDDVTECRIIAKAYLSVGYKMYEERNEEILLDNSTEYGRID